MSALIFYDALSAEAGAFYPDDAKAFWIALDPKAQCHLIRSGISRGRIHTEVGWLSNECREHLVRRSAGLMAWLRQQARFPEMGDLEWSVSEILLWYAYWGINSCLWILELSRLFSDVCKPDALCACVSPMISHRGPFIMAQDGFLANLTAAFAARRGVPFQPLASPERGSYAPGRRPVMEVLKRAAYPVWLRYRRVGLRRALRSVAKAEPGLIVATTATYRMGMVIQRLRDRGIQAPAYLLNEPVARPFDGNFSPYPLAASIPEDGPVQQALKNRLDALSDTVEKETERFFHADVSFAALLARKMREGIAPFVTATYCRGLAIEFILRTARPRVVLAAGDLDEDRFTGAICRRLKVPAVMISHGSHVIPKSDAERIEWGEHTIGKMQSPFPYMALQSPLAEAHLKVFPSDSVPIQTGPLLWGSAIDRQRAQALRRAMLGDRDVRVITHASTPKGGRSTRFYIYETPNEYVQGIAELAEAVEALPDAHLIVKFRPSALISTDDLRALVRFSDKVTLSVDEPFLDVLGFTDLLVSFSSTTVEEALLNRVPVLFYGGGGRYQHVASPVYQPGRPLPVSPVYAIRDSADLVGGLEEIFKRIQDLIPDAFRPFCYAPEQIEPIEDVVRRFCCEGNAKEKKKRTK